MRFQKFMSESSQMIDADAASVTMSSLKKELTRLHGQIRYSEEQIKEAGKNEKDKWAIKEYQAGIDNAKKRIQKVEQQIRDNQKLNESENPLTSLARKSVAAHPELKDDIIEIISLARSEIEEGGSPSNEYDHAEHDIDNLIRKKSGKPAEPQTGDLVHDAPGGSEYGDRIKVTGKKFSYYSIKWGGNVDYDISRLHPDEKHNGSGYWIFK